MKHPLRLSAVALAAFAAACALPTAAADAMQTMPRARTPIHHLIVIVGENHSFDNLFGGYRPPRGQHVDNLLSKGIINADGTPGPNFALAAQNEARDTDRYRLDPARTGAYATLPQPNTTYATGVPHNVPDTRFPADLPNGPYQITHYVPYDAYVGDPVHRFFQMWQQVSRGRHDLFTWVAQTVGIGPQNGAPAPTPDQTYQGGVAMGFYNMSTGDAPYFKSLARHYAISDNYHQAIMGGTGANFFAIATGDVAFYNTGGRPTPPPANQVENPDPGPGTNNFYTQDGYRGGSYVECADPVNPGVGEIRGYLATLPYHAFRDGNCAADTYYLLNNYAPGYTPTGEPKPLGPNQFVLPPQTVPTIAESLARAGVSWKWYSGGRNGGSPTREYCSICDPFTFSKAVMTSNLKDNLEDVTDFYADVAQGTLPAVAFVRPFESMAGHPANATIAGYERFVKDLIQRVQANPGLWAHTAILITMDEGGGYYDSGYIQPLDFFGDGTRIPLIAVSPYAKKGHVDHVYADHASILKFIERNWGLQPLSARSRDNLPNPKAREDNPYVPVNAPAIGDLMSLFRFHRGDDAHERSEDGDRG